MESSLVSIATYRKVKNLFQSGLSKIDDKIEQMQDLVSDADLAQLIDKDFNDEISTLLFIYSRQIGAGRYSMLVDKHRPADQKHKEEEKVPLSPQPVLEIISPQEVQTPQEVQAPQEGPRWSEEP